MLPLTRLFSLPDWVRSRYSPCRSSRTGTCEATSFRAARRGACTRVMPRAAPDGTSERKILEHLDWRDQDVPRRPQQGRDTFRIRRTKRIDRQ